MSTPVSRASTRVSEVQELLEEMTSSLLDQLKQALMQLDASQVIICFFLDPLDAGCFNRRCENGLETICFRGVTG